MLGTVEVALVQRYFGASCVAALSTTALRMAKSSMGSSSTPAAAWNSATTRPGTSDVTTSRSTSPSYASGQCLLNESGWLCPPGRVKPGPVVCSFAPEAEKLRSNSDEKLLKVLFPSYQPSSSV